MCFRAFFQLELGLSLGTLPIALAVVVVVGGEDQQEQQHEAVPVNLRRPFDPFFWIFLRRISIPSIQLYLFSVCCWVRTVAHRLRISYDINCVRNRPARIPVCVVLVAGIRK
jgi:hypothetical protein